ADSIIYQFFKGKQDLLFSIPAEREEEYFLLLDEHLQGISDVESQLSKMIWFYLRYLDVHPNYANILFFECFSSKDFYLSDGYGIIRKFSAIVLQTLKQGAAEGRINASLDLHLVRDVILGTLGCEGVACFALGETKEIVPDHEEIMGLLRAMIRPRKEPEESKPDMILKAAEKVFAEKGFTRAKVSEIAKLAGVAEGTVYEYFGSKEDLLLSIPVKHFERYTEDLLQMFEIQTPLKKLRRFIEYYFSLFSTDPDFLQVFLIQLQLSKRYYGTKEYDSFKNYFRTLEQVVEEGKKEGCFRENVNSRVFRNMFIGAFNNLALRWFILGEDKHFDKMEKINQVKDLLCSAVTVHDEG
ncbi:MAG: TetR/AcrR family transcriptional regulator, partial [Deltaproteobacteria bacterium]|nr:TetR/AcrR family transcriptional regulator [Deltaproteobacteria bacterium]